ncbi:uncharacterized protein FIBRA_05657 [Fibroporia radiculosa]|uniref:Xylanolytic transcriptional activator regulatory domain-containing protein n=1 Tax=Fibroporia radiculosa TaxID=599839 RepID=J4G9W2_9APHY|nr:uncharacterized protein FIBRA_05657 [Fibroporia radiculosa]CCM03523.1 predicted protein [Fibroporia radiculosa]
MLSPTVHHQMATAPDYHDDQRSAKRPRTDSMCEGLRPYTIANPSVNSEADNADGSKRNRKRPLSCGECRRSVHLDRYWRTGHSQTRSGVKIEAQVRSYGALTGGKGSRFILANTEQLHEKIKIMAERIRQLEDALQRIQSEHSTEPHPLMRQELLAIKKSPELFTTERTSHTGSDVNRRDEGDSPGAGSSTMPDAGEEPEYISSMTAITSLGLPADIAKLSSACPMSQSINSELNPHLRQRIRDMLPSRSEGERLCDQARTNAFWHFCPDAGDTCIPNLIHSVYTTPLSALMPHRLSLFFMILAIGNAVDLHPNYDPDAAERYHHLARAALCETAIIDDPSFDAVTTLFYMIWYLLVFSNHKKAVEHAWGLMGLLAKLAQSLGLHRDGVGKMIPEEMDRRKVLLWNIMAVDVRLALMLRRPPSICSRHVDVKRPSLSSLSDPQYNVSSAYHDWRDAFLVQCQYPILELSISPQPPSYLDVLALDAKIRDYEIPTALRMVDNDGVVPNHPTGMQQALTLCTREIAILNLHRSYFTEALRVNEGFTVKHKYAPSVLATYTSSCNLFWAINTCYKWDPDLTVRISMIWSNCLSAAVALCLLLGRAPSSPFSPHALQELDKLRVLFNEIRDRCQSVARSLPALESCVAKVRMAYVNWCNGSIDSWVDPCTDEVGMVAKRAGLVPAEEPHTIPLTEANPFEHAHSSLRRCYESFITEVPSTFIDPFPGQLESSLRIGMAQTYNTSAERTAQVGEGLAVPSSNESTTASAAFNPSYMATEFLDNSWMSWF